MTDKGYIYDADWEQERARLAKLEQTSDPYTKLHLERLGLREGWRCLEVGGGGGAIVAWMCERVGSSGRVVATDLDTRFLDVIDAENLEVRRHDIVNDPLEQDAFDLVHSRYVLEHLPERERALDNLIAAVKPGGWLLVEDVDVTDMARPDDIASSDPVRRAEFFRGHRAFMESRGVDAAYGGRLPALLLARGLVDVDAATRRHLMRVGSQADSIARLSILALKDDMIAGGFVSPEDADALLEMLESPDTIGLSPTTVSAWGRKP